MFAYIDFGKVVTFEGVSKLVTDFENQNIRRQIMKMKKIENKGIPNPQCIDGKGIWSDNLDFDATDEVLEKFYEHAELCPYHKALIEKETESLTKVLEGFKSPLILRKMTMMKRQYK